MTALADLSIRTKLYLALFTTVFLVTLILISFLQYNAYTFRSYLHHVDDRLTARIAERLETQYSEVEPVGWRFPVTDFNGWLFQNRLFPFAPPPASGASHVERPTLPTFPPGEASPPELPVFGGRQGFAPMEAFVSRLVLRGPDKAFLAGTQSNAAPERSVALKHDGELIGWLELLPLARSVPTPVSTVLTSLAGPFAGPGTPVDGIIANGERPGTSQMQTSLSLVLVSIVAILLFGLPLTQHFTGRIDALFEGANKLSQGDFTTRVSLHGKDELAQLAQRFNYLAEVLQKNKENQRMWVSNISHELRTPLGILKGELEAIQDGVRPADADEIAMLSHEVAQINTLIDDLFMLSKSDVGGLSYNPTPSSLPAILEASIARFQDRAIAKNLSIVDNLSELADCQVFGDAQRLGQLFSNLMQNSIEYTSGGGLIAIKVTAAPETIHVTIEDSCPGVTSAQLERLFERFYRAEQSRNRSTGGSGLGLAICKSIAEAHQGAIAASHSVLGGIAISLSLPRA